MIAFTSNRDGDWEIYTIRPDGTGLTRLTNSSGNDAHGGVVAGWTMARLFQRARRLQGRNGAWRRRSDRDRRFVIRADGSDVRRLTDDAAEEVR